MTQANEGMYMALVDTTVSSTKGHTLRFKAGEPKYVPEAIRRDARAANVLPLDEAEQARDRLLGATKAKEEALAKQEAQDKPQAQNAQPRRGK